MFEAIVTYGVEYENIVNSDIGRANIRNELAGLGVGRADLDKAVDTVILAIERSLQDERGLWLLDSSHHDSRCEYALESVDDRNVLTTSVIDRTFIDTNGTRWIIDYKTSSHSGGGIDEFLDREMERYQAQLNRYASLIRQIEDRPIKLGLYFPLLNGWREWDYLPDQV